MSANSKSILQRQHTDIEGIEIHDQCDWAWRPKAWSHALKRQTSKNLKSGTQIGEGLTLFHDCPIRDIVVEQSECPDSHAPFDISIKVGKFDGSFFSLVFDLPREAQSSMDIIHIIGISGRIKLPLDIKAFARVNVKHGPNTERVLDALTQEAGSFKVELDLGEAMIKDKAMDHAWIDIIFENPAHADVIIHDLALTRHPRFEI